MATAQFPLAHYPGVDVVVVYDDVTRDASAVQANNQSAADCFVTVTNVANPAITRSGTLRAGQSGTISVSGAVSLTRSVVAPGTTPIVSLQGWNVSSRWPA